MSTKATNSQTPVRRTTLSLSTATKPNKPTSDNSNINTNIQKTEHLKKDSNPEKKASSDKKQPSTETRKPSVDARKHEEVKPPTKVDDNKKNQNGVNSTNGIKDKPNTNGGGPNKPKSDEPSTSTNNTNIAFKKEPQKSVEKKAATEAAAKVPSKDIQIDDNKKVKEKDDNNKKDDVKKKEKVEVKDPIENKKINEKKSDTKKGKIDEKATEQKSIPIETLEKAKEAEKIEKETKDIVDIKKLPKPIITGSPVKEKKQTETANTPKKVDLPKQEEKEEVPTSEFELTDVEMMEMMEPLIFVETQSPRVSAASTPSKTFNRSAELPHSSPKSEEKPAKPALIPSPDRKSCPRTFSSISGRRTIRPIGDYTFSGNLNIRESYRKINTELDFTTSSLNVTVGSEVPNNDSFSFFSRSRKRDRSSPTHQSTIEIQADISPRHLSHDISPKSPKRPRIESSVSGFFSAMASPITMLRSRLSRATVQSTPKKLVEVSIEDDIVENVSGISVEEEITATEDLTVNPDSTVEIVISEEDNLKEELAPACSAKLSANAMLDDDIKIKETITSTETAKKKCNIM